NKFRTNQNFPPSLMPRELGRWHRPARWETGSDRWSAWARSLIERHGLVVLHHSAPAMIVLHHLPLLHLLHERWGVSSRQYYPRVHLSVQAILQQTVWREQQRYLPSLPHAGSPLEVQ